MNNIAADSAGPLAKPTRGIGRGKGCAGMTGTTKISENGWIELLSIVLKTNVRRRLNAVAIDYDALGDLLETIDLRQQKVLQLVIDKRLTLRSIGKMMRITGQSVACIRNKALRNLLHGELRMRMFRRAVGGWWNITHCRVPVDPKPNKPFINPGNSNGYNSCLVITNFNKPVIKTKEVVKTTTVTEVKRKVRIAYREPQWKPASKAPSHMVRLVAMNWNATRPIADEREAHGRQHRGKCWLAVYDAVHGVYLCHDGEKRTFGEVSHWYELPSPDKLWSQRDGAYHVLSPLIALGKTLGATTCPRV